MALSSTVRPSLNELPMSLHHPEMDAAPSRIVSVVLGLIMLAAIFLWSGFIFAPTWLDRLLSF